MPPNPLMDQLFSSFLRTSPSAAPQTGLNTVFQDTLNLLNPSNQNEAQLNQPLSELMRMFGADDADLSSTTSLNIFNVFFQSLRIGDMLDLIRGQNRHVVFERTRQPLRDHLRDNYQITAVNAATDVSHTVDSLVDRLYLDMFISENTGGLNLELNALFPMADPDVDFAQSFEKLVKTHLKKACISYGGVCI